MENSGNQKIYANSQFEKLQICLNEKLSESDQSARSFKKPKIAKVADQVFMPSPSESEKTLFLKNSLNIKQINVQTRQPKQIQFQKFQDQNLISQSLTINSRKLQYEQNEYLYKSQCDIELKVQQQSSLNIILENSSSKLQLPPITKMQQEIQQIPDQTWLNQIDSQVEEVLSPQVNQNIEKDSQSEKQIIYGDLRKPKNTETQQILQQSDDNDSKILEPFHFNKESQQKIDQYLDDNISQKKPYENLIIQQSNIRNVKLEPLTHQNKSSRNMQTRSIDTRLANSQVLNHHQFSYTTDLRQRQGSFNKIQNCHSAVYQPRKINFENEEINLFQYQQECSQLQEQMNSQSQFLGLKRASRPPVYYWSKSFDYIADYLILSNQAENVANSDNIEEDQQMLLQNQDQNSSQIDSRVNQAQTSIPLQEEFNLQFEACLNLSQRRNQLLITPMPQKTESDKSFLKIFAVSWNMQGRTPSFQNLDELFQKNNVSHDMIVVGSQEAIRPIVQSMVVASKNELNTMILDYFNDMLPEQYKPISDQKKEPYIMVHSNTLAAIHIMIIVKKELVQYLSDIKSESMALGLCKVLTNKGAVMISFKLGSSKMLFINCHLEAHDEGLEKRNAQWKNINKKFVMKKEKPSEEVSIISSPVNIKAKVLPPLRLNSQNIMKRRNSYNIMVPSCLEKHHSSKQEELIQSQETPKWDSVIWIGDFNYRINATDSNIVRMLIENNEWNILEAIDQLTIEKKIKRVAVGFNEGKINFAPTFKFKSQTSIYNTKRQPSWTDRILYRCRDNILQLVNYESNNNVQMSDHRPVFAQFKFIFDKDDDCNQEIRNIQKGKVRNMIIKKGLKLPPRPKQIVKLNSVVPFNEQQEINKIDINTKDQDSQQISDKNNEKLQENENNLMQQSMTSDVSAIFENMKIEDSNLGNSKTKACNIF